MAIIYTDSNCMNLTNCPKKNEQNLSKIVDNSAVTLLPHENAQQHQLMLATASAIATVAAANRAAAAMAAATENIDQLS